MSAPEPPDEFPGLHTSPWEESPSELLARL